MTKHWYIDFVNQTMEEVEHKGIYLDWLGVKHSVKHGVITALCIWLVSSDVYLACILGTVDFLIHYHVDYIKMKYGCRDITQPLFWNHLGLDQLIHHVTYLGIAVTLANTI